MSKEDRADKIAALLAQLAGLLSEDSPPPAEIPAPRVSPERFLLTVEEAAQRLHIGRTRMFSLVKSGEIDSIRVGRLRRINPIALEEYAQRLKIEQSRESEK
jgi:excisionase family DNA binding protein